MTTTHHTPIEVNAPANSATFNTPLGELDAAINNVLAGNGAGLFTRLRFNPQTTLTIASGVITTTQNLHLIAAESGTTDNLDTITAVNNSILYLKADTGDTITVTTAGNILNGFILSGNTIACLFCQNNVWSLVSGTDGSAVQYTPADNSNWGGSDPGNTDDALDYLGGRTLKKGHLAGFEVDVSGTTTVTIRAGECISNNNQSIIARNQFQISTLITGAGGMDTGSIAADTWYYIWLVKGSSGVSAVISADLTPVLPSGYDSYRRWIGMVRTDGSGNLRFQKTQYGMGNRRLVIYNANTTAAPYLVANAQDITNGSYDTINCSAVVPPDYAFMARAFVSRANAGGILSVRENSSQVIQLMSVGAYSAQVEIPINSSSSFEITSSAAGNEGFTCMIFGYYIDLSFDSGIYVT